MICWWGLRSQYRKMSEPAWASAHTCIISALDPSDIMWTQPSSVSLSPGFVYAAPSGLLFSMTKRCKSGKVNLKEYKAWSFTCSKLCTQNVWTWPAANISRVEMLAPKKHEARKQSLSALKVINVLKYGNQGLTAGVNTTLHCQRLDRPGQATLTSGTRPRHHHHRLGTPKSHLVTTTIAQLKKNSSY